MTSTTTLMHRKNECARSCARAITNGAESVAQLRSRDNTPDDTWGFLGVSYPFEPLDQRDHSDGLNCLRGEARPRCYVRMAECGLSDLVRPMDSHKLEALIRVRAISSWILPEGS